MEQVGSQAGYLEEAGLEMAEIGKHQLEILELKLGISHFNLN